MPLEIAGCELGVIQLINRTEGGEAGEYTERDRMLLQVLAQLITQSISHAAAAARDHLTGLYNSRTFHERLGRSLDDARKREEELCVLFLDLDHFKQVNDRYGHLVGSRTLVAVARLLRESIRRTDFLCRYGGDEFILILPSTRLEDAVQVAEKLRCAIEGSSILDDPALDLDDLTCSIGCASTNGIGEDRQTLLRMADQAMYRAKEGRNRVERMVVSDEAPGS